MNLIFSKSDLKKLILPLILEQFLAITVGMADTMMISSVGEAAVSGVSLVDMINNLIISILAALATGGTVVTSQFIGARDMKSANRSAKQLIFASGVIAVLIAVFAIGLNTPILRLFFGQIDADVMENAIIYFIISALSFPSLAVYSSCAALFRAMGNAKVTLKVSILMNLINVVGNAICIYGLRMGVAGVALPSLISRTVAGVVLYVMLKNPENMIYLSREKFHVEMGVIKKILYIGVPSSIENGIFQLGRVLVVSIISLFGTVQIAANGVANNLDSLGCILGQAMGLAMITVVGRCVGAGDANQVKYFTKKLLIWTYIGTVCINSIILLTMPWILSFYGLGSETLVLAKTLVWIHNGMAMLLWPLSFVLPNALRACNDVRYTMVVSIFSMFVFRIGFSYVLGIHMEMGAIGVWIAMVLDWIFRVSCFVGRYLSGKWKNMCPAL